MINLKNKISLILGGVVGAFASYYTSLETTVQILMLFMVLDFATGILKAYSNKTLMSNTMFKGALRKGMVFTIIIVARHLGETVGVPAVKDMTVIYYITMETLSIFEHTVDFGVPLPKFLKEFAERLKSENDDVEVIENDL